jgi:hypothetical protein
MFKKLLNPDTRNTLMTDMLSLLPLDGEEEDGNDNDTLPWDENTTKPISQDLRSALRESVGFTPSKARSLSHLTIGGLTYSVTSKHAGNSNILFKPHPDSPAIPSQIDYVLQFHVNKTFVHPLPSAATFACRSKVILFVTSSYSKLKCGAADWDLLKYWNWMKFFHILQRLM